MNDRPSEPINLTTQRDSNRVAIASKFAPKVFVTYPSFDVWRSVYDPNDLFHRFNDQRFGPGGYQSMRQSHLASVTKSLNRIHDFSTGKAVLHQMQATNARFTAEIYPRVFMPARSFRTAWAMEELKQLTPLEAICVEFGTGAPECAHVKGGGAIVFFDAHRKNGPFMPEDVLTHELVHAGRDGLGITRRGRSVADYTADSAGVWAYEEFIADLIRSVFRSERGAAPFNYFQKPINPKTFLTAEIRNVISELLREQPVFRSIADIQCHFNPIRDVAKAP